MCQCSICSICSIKTDNKDLNPISGENDTICLDCLDQLWEQVQEVPTED